MRWNPFRAGAQSAPEPAAGPPGKPPVDKITMAIRQRRMFTAQQRVDQLPGFSKLERRWCEQPTAHELDAQLAALGDRESVRWPDRETLAGALRTASALAPSTPAQVFLAQEPEARWVEARESELLAAIAAALPALRMGLTMLSEGGRALKVFVWADADSGDRPAFETTMFGEWPPDIQMTLSPTMPR